MNEFDLKNIVEDIESLSEKDGFEKRIEIFLLKSNKKDNEIYKQQANDETKKVLFEGIIKELNTPRFKNREVHPYDIVNNKKNVHELVDISQYPNIAAELTKISNENNWIMTTKGLDETNFQIYMVHLNGEVHDYKLFGSFSNSITLKKKMIFGNFTNSGLKISDSDRVVGFNRKIDLVVIDNKYVLINQAESKFESLFKMQALFSTQALQILKENCYILQVYSQESLRRLSEKVSVGKRLATRLIKIVANEERLAKTIENISKIEEIIKDSEHPFHKYVKDVKYIDSKLSAPEGAENQLISAISDAFYKAVISETRNIDGTRM